jgi:hypothetical protein
MEASRERERDTWYLDDVAGATHVGFSRVLLTTFVTTLDVDSGVLVVVSVMGNDFPQVTGVLRRPPVGDGDGERSSDGASS